MPLKIQSIHNKIQNIAIKSIAESKLSIMLIFGLLNHLMSYNLVFNTNV